MHTIKKQWCVNCQNICNMTMKPESVKGKTPVVLSVCGFFSPFVSIKIINFKGQDRNEN